MWRVAALVVIGSLAGAGCEWNSPASPDASGGPTADARHRVDAGDDAGTDIDAAPGAGHLLLTEVTLAPPGSEFIEIYNPTAAAVDLAQYYLSDNGNYWNLPAGMPTLPTGDFIVQFPAGSSIPAGGVITVATGTAALFTTAFGAAPTYSIADSTITHTDVSGTPTLTDAGESVILFQWDGSAALIKDVDIMLAGKPVGANLLTPVKTGGYAPDANTIAVQASSPGTGKSTKRIAAETGHETQDGTGNGITGDDETSEDTTMTWDTAFTAPTPGQVPAGF